jgi:HSP20 family molecular chaperone IbpA
MTSFFDKLNKNNNIGQEESQKELKNDKILLKTGDKKPEGKWLETEGQLAIDVYQTDEELIIQSAIAGVKGDELDITIEGDKVTIRGMRDRPEKEEKMNYFYQECYWGPFSREIILPVEIDPGRAEAIFKEGILTIRIPKVERDKRRKLSIKE